MSCSSAGANSAWNGANRPVRMGPGSDTRGNGISLELFCNFPFPPRVGRFHNERPLTDGDLNLTPGG